jgi:hypothetical protein
MIRAVDYQKLDMTDEEFTYYQELVKSLTTDGVDGSLYFHDLFLSDERGIITIIKPMKPIPWDVMFWAQNVMINQHLRELDGRLEKLEQYVKSKESIVSD